jgi:hypothetical protein
MVTVKLLGRVLPFGLNIGAEAPELRWKWGERNIEFIFRVKIVDSNITVECDLDRYEDRYDSELYKRATDLARACVNLVAFETGFGLIAMIEVIELPDGTRKVAHRREIIPPEARSAYSLDAARASDFDQVFKLVVQEPPLFIALDDLIRSITEQHTSAANCGRVVDRIRRIIAPSLDGAAAWQEMHKALNISRDYQEWVSKQSTGTRHGDSTFVPGAVSSEAIQRTWAILNRFLEYRKRGNRPLTPPDFPELV